MMLIKVQIEIDPVAAKHVRDIFNLEDGGHEQSADCR